VQRSAHCAGHHHVPLATPANQPQIVAKRRILLLSPTHLPSVYPKNTSARRVGYLKSTLHTKTFNLWPMRGRLTVAAAAVAAVAKMLSYSCSRRTDPSINNLCKHSPREPINIDGPERNKDQTRVGEKTFPLFHAARTLLYCCCHRSSRPIN